MCLRERGITPLMEEKITRHPHATEKLKISLINCHFNEVIDVQRRN
jgi:hypothetical protein